LLQGTGKTTVARHIAKILKDSGARRSDSFTETSAQKLKDDGPDKFRALVNNNGIFLKTSLLLWSKEVE